MVGDTVGPWCTTPWTTGGEECSSRGRGTTFLNLDHGTYPYVASSNPVAGGCGLGPSRAAGHRPRHRHRRGLHVTRVGAGPFPTEQDSRDVGGHTAGGAGATSSAPTPGAGAAAVGSTLRHAAHDRAPQLHDRGRAPPGLDVLDARSSPLKVCVAYEADGIRYTHLPYHQSTFHEAAPIYEELPEVAHGSHRSAARFRATCPPPPMTTCTFLSEQIGGARAPGRGSVQATREQTVSIRHRKSRVCIVGSGGREHGARPRTLARTADVIVTRGNPGMAPPITVEADAEPVEDVEADLYVIGPRSPAWWPAWPTDLPIAGAGPAPWRAPAPTAGHSWKVPRRS